jgi:hypothetical protein
MAVADEGGIVVSRTVKELAFGSDIEFTDLGERGLRGVPGIWALFEGRQHARASSAAEQPRVLA